MSINPVDQVLAEEGLPLPEPVSSPAESLPPGGGKLVLPHFATFSQITNLLARAYRWTFDEALKHSQENALAIRRDPVIMDALRARQIPVAQLSWHLEAQDDTDPKQVESVKDLTQIIESIPNFQQYRMHLQEAVWYGRYGVQNSFSFCFDSGHRQMVVENYKPMNGDKLVFRFSGQVGILIHSTFKDDNTSITDRGRAHFFTPEEREQVVIHKHEPEDADFWEGDMAGAIFGVGIRSRIYWLWWLRSQVTAFLMDYLERVGAGGFTIYYYEAGNQNSLTEVKTAAETQWRNNTILFPRYRDGSTGGPGIDRIEASQAGAALLSTLITEYFDTVIRRYILGQTLSSESGATGLGSGVAEFQEDTLSRIIKYDAINLQETLTHDLVKVLAKYNHPGVPAPKFVFDVDKPNAAETLHAAKDFYEMGGQVDEDELRSVLGLSKPQPGHNILAKLPSVSPTGVGALPTGVPMSGTPGPDQQALQGAAPPQGQQPSQEDQDSQVLFARRGQRVKLAALKQLQPDPKIRASVQDYLNNHNPDFFGPADYHPVYPELSKKIASYYDQAPHSPNDPKVQAAYDAFKKETMAQYNHLKQQGVKFEPWQKEGQPYANSQEMTQDARNGHLYFFTGGDMGPDNLLAGQSGETVNGVPLTHNDVFRAVHDYYGHALYGNQFGPRGEEHAYRTHSRMYSDQARPAMAFETRGQNSWVNFGPHSSLPVTERPYAQQKNNVLPSELMDTNSPADKGIHFAAKGATVKAPSTTGSDDFDPAVPGSGTDKGMGNVADISKAATPIPTKPVPGKGKQVEDAKPAPKSFQETQLTGEQAVKIAHQDTSAHKAARNFQIEHLGKSLSENDRRLWDEISQDVDTEQLRMLKEKDMATLLNAWKKIEQKAPDAQWHEAVKGGIIKRGWYRKVMPAIKGLFPHGSDADRFIALLAATSPQKSVTANLVMALDIWKAWNQLRVDNPAKAHDPETIKKMLVDLQDEFRSLGTSQEVFNKKKDKYVTEYSPRVNVGGELLKQGWNPAAKSEMPNVLRVLTADHKHDWHSGNMLSGPKVESFRRNLMGYLDHATNDVWMSYFADIPQSAFSGRKNTATGKAEQKPFYMAFTAKTRQIARQLNAKLAVGEQPWSAAEIQETVWSFVRGIAKFIGLQKLKNKRDVSPTQALKEITHEDLGDTVDFLTEALNNPDVSKRLKVLLGPGNFSKAIKRIRSISESTSPIPEKEKSKRAVPRINPILERIARIGEAHKGQFASGRVKTSAKTSAIKVNLSPFLRSVFESLTAA